MSDDTRPKAGLMNIGHEAKPPVAVLPEPAALFAGRARRLEALSEGHAIGGYLRLVAEICRAQARLVETLPQPAMPEMRRAAALPLQIDAVVLGPEAEIVLSRLCGDLQAVDAPEAFKKALARLQGATADERYTVLVATLADDDADGDIAVRTLAAAALQVYFTRLAAGLDGDGITRVVDATCPVCGSAPVASAVVSWQSANNTRFCTCSLCATQWHVVRLKCVSCSSTKGISYPHIEGQADGLRAETCAECRHYVKIVYQVKDPAFEPFADDIASLDLDMMLKQDGWTRGGRNPFLSGY
jgi:FdhE protein